MTFKSRTAVVNPSHEESATAGMNKPWWSYSWMDHREKFLRAHGWFHSCRPWGKTGCQL